jgi:hypothetical protein
MGARRKAGAGKLWGSLRWTAREDQTDGGALAWYMVVVIGDAKSTASYFGLNPLPAPCPVCLYQTEQ